MFASILERIEKHITTLLDNIHEMKARMLGLRPEHHQENTIYGHGSEHEKRGYQFKDPEKLVKDMRRYRAAFQEYKQKQEQQTSNRKGNDVAADVLLSGMLSADNDAAYRSRDDDDSSSTDSSSSPTMSPSDF